MFMDRGGYSCTVRGCRGPYEGDPFDFVAGYLIPLDLWYIIPAEKCQGQGSIALYPRLKKSFFFQAEDGIRDYKVTGVQTCALPISAGRSAIAAEPGRRFPAARK